MKTDKLILDKAGIETVSEELTINSEIETRINTRWKITRSLDRESGNYCGEVFELPFDILEKMQEENNHYIQKLLDLKKEICPFKHITPIHSDKYEVGAILTDSWGWEQTNIDFYCIVRRVNDSVTIMPMTKQSGEFGHLSMSREEMPGVIDFTKDPQRKKIYRSRESGGNYGKEIGFSLRNYSGGGWCNLWDGEKETSTHYA